MIELLMGFRPLAGLLVLASGVLMVLLSHIPKKDGEIQWHHASADLFLGPPIILFGLYLMVTSIL